MLVARVLYLSAASTADQATRKWELFAAKLLTTARMAEWTVRELQLVMFTEAGMGPFGWIMLGMGAIATTAYALSDIRSLG
jgi:hypothetical protein